MNQKELKFQENKEALKENMAKAFEKAFIEMGDKAKEIDWFVCNRFSDKK
jgi:3-oxoacyl-[acyl-carrier-protein] synthase III